MCFREPFPSLVENYEFKKHKRKKILLAVNIFRLTELKKVKFSPLTANNSFEHWVFQCKIKRVPGKFGCTLIEGMCIRPI